MRKHLKQFIQHPLFSGSALMVIGSNSVNALNYLYHLVVGRMLGPSIYGELAALISVIGLLSIVPGAFGIVITKYISGAKSEAEVINLASWLKASVFRSSVILFVLILAMSPFATNFLHIDSVSYLILIAVSFLFSLSSSINRSILQGLLNFRDFVITILVENFSKLLLSILFIYFGFQLFGAMFALVISAVVGWFLTNIYLKKYFTAHFSTPHNIKSVFKFTPPVIIQSIAVTSLYSSDIILVKHFFPAHDVGIYAALSTLGKIIFFGSGPIAAVMFPLVSSRNSKGQKYVKIFLFSLIATLALAAFVLGIYWLLPAFAIKLLYGSSYIEASGLLIWFGFFMTLFTLSSLLINFNISLGKTKVVIFPVIAAFLQIIGIWFYHPSLFAIILLSNIIVALLLLFLLIYSVYSQRD